MRNLVRESLDENLKQKIVNFVERRRFSFDQEDELANDRVNLIFSTREHGRVYDESYGEEDFRAGYAIKKELLETFSKIEVEVETVDEFVTISVII